MDFTKTLEQLCKTPGVTGSEKYTIAPVVAKLMGGEVDAAGNAWKRIGDGERQIIVEAHIDEVGFRITNLMYECAGDCAWAKFVPIGGMNPEKQLGAKVVAGEYKGIVSGGKTFAKQQINFLGEYDFSEINLAPNAIVHYERNFAVAESGQCSSPALDNRTSTTVLCLLGQSLQPVSGFSIYLVGSVHHEQGNGNGLKLWVNKINPEFVLDLDSAYAKPYKKDSWWGIPILGRGPAIQASGEGYVADEDLIRRIQGIAESEKIPYQWEIPAPDAGGLSVTGIGVRKLALNIPVRNQHTPLSQCNLADVENSYKLVKTFFESKW